MTKMASQFIGRWGLSVVVVIVVPVAAGDAAVLVNVEVPPGRQTDVLAVSVAEVWVESITSALSKSMVSVTLRPHQNVLDGMVLGAAVDKYNCLLVCKIIHQC